MNQINKKYIVIIGFLLLALLLIVWPSAKTTPKAPEETVKDQELQGGLAGKETLVAEKEEKTENIPGSYSGHVTIDSMELVGKTLLAKIPVSLAKKQIETELAKGLDVRLIITKDGAWTLDLGDTFSVYQITTIVSTQEDKINMEDGAFQANRGFYIPDLGDNIYLSIKAHVLDKVQGTLLIEGDTSTMKMSIVGSFTLLKEEKKE